MAGRRAAVVIFSLLIGCCGGAARAGGLRAPMHLRCESRENPIGVDVHRPQLSWRLEAADPAARDLAQSAWRMVVASFPEKLGRDEGDCWDSGRVESTETHGIEYAGAPLEFNRQYWWKAMVWDGDGEPSDWSEPASWTMGLTFGPGEPNGWAAQWIRLEDCATSGSTMFRREFPVREGLRRATLHVSGLGQYHFMLNGRRVGDAVLTPGWTDYRKTVLYDSHDVTELLCPGDSNAAGVLLGNGFYKVVGGGGRYTKLKTNFGPQKLIAQLCLEYDDGTTETVVTGDAWRGAKGPITYSNLYGGEDYDARLEPDGWSEPGFDDAVWRPAVQCDGPGGALRGLSVAGLPVKTFESLKPVQITKIDKKTIVYDLGQNAAIMPRQTVSGPAGSSVRIRGAEILMENGRVDDRMCAQKSWWTYTLRGEGSEVWSPDFHYRGARYLQLELSPAPKGGDLPEIKSIEGVVVHADADPVGEFECSSELFNRIHSMVRWAQRSNMMSILTDCPHREKLGWLEQDYLNGPALRYEFDLNLLFEKIVHDIADAQQPNGMVPNIAPEYTEFGWWGDMQFRESPEWGCAFILIPYQQYGWTGDKRLIETHYDAMKKYWDYLGTHVTDGILEIPGALGDWYDLGPNPPGRAQLTPPALTATAIYYEATIDLLCMAGLAGRNDDVIDLYDPAVKIRNAFNRKYFNENASQYAGGSQTAAAMGMTLAEPENCKSAVKSLVENIQANGGSTTAGDIGFRYIMRALADHGRSDVIAAMLCQDAKPGYAWQLKTGATSLPESWDARSGSSQNHFMLGPVTEWFYGDLAGINLSMAAPGAPCYNIAPQCLKDLEWVKASHRSIHGLIESAWRRESDRTILEVTIPVNCSATVSLPARLLSDIHESGSIVNGENNALFKGWDEDGARLKIGSGQYRFEFEEAKSGKY